MIKYGKVVFFSVILCSLLAFTGCLRNRPPIANAGPDQIVEINSLVTLDGSASYDPDGDPLSFRWTQIAGSPVTLSNPMTMRPTFIPKAVGTYTFQLVVNDGRKNSAPDWVNILVITPPSQPPPLPSGNEIEG